MNINVVFGLLKCLVWACFMFSPILRLLKFLKSTSSSQNKHFWKPHYQLTNKVKLLVECNVRWPLLWSGLGDLKRFTTSKINIFSFKSAFFQRTQSSRDKDPMVINKTQNWAMASEKPASSLLYVSLVNNGSSSYCHGKKKQAQDLATNMER